MIKLIRNLPKELTWFPVCKNTISLKPLVPTTIQFWDFEDLFSNAKDHAACKAYGLFLHLQKFNSKYCISKEPVEPTESWANGWYVQKRHEVSKWRGIPRNLEKYYYRNTRPEFREPSCAKSKKSWPWSCPERSGGIINRAPKQKQKLHVWFRLGYVLHKHVAGDFQSLFLPMSSLETFSTLWF